ncbi:MAG TPA: DUF1285 domain-containing protein [Stellaceae bacterium]|nr:DUF1285 domain-containing protein [Stellaceae bacterium]
MAKIGSGKTLRTRPAAARRAIVDCGDLGIRIARDGTWFYRESPINRLPLVKLFASVLTRDPDGGYALVTPAERGRVEVEDAPFLAVDVTPFGEGRAQDLIFRTNLDDIVTAGPLHRLRVETAASGEPAPYIHVRGGLEAKLTRAVFYELVELGRDEPAAGARQFGVWSGGAFFRLGDSVEE